MTTPNGTTGLAAGIGTDTPNPHGQTPREDDVFETGADHAVALVALSIANRLSTDRVDDVAIEYLNGFCSWLPMEAEIIREIVDLLVPDRVDNHDVCEFLDRNTDLTPQQVTTLITQIASLRNSDAIDTLLHDAGVPSREELLLLADYLEELAHNLFEQALSIRTQSTGGQGGEPAPITSTLVSAAPESAAVAAQTNAATAPVDHQSSQIDVAKSTAPPPGTAATRHAETSQQPGHIAHHWWP